MPPDLFTLVIFQIRSCIYAQIGLDYDPPIYASHVAGVTSMHRHAQLFCSDRGILNFLPKLALISTSQVARITGYL
jgi:hypothetical protein